METIYFDKDKKFIKVESVLDRIGITRGVLYSLAESGNFPLGELSGNTIVIANGFFQYLDRHHFTKRRDPNQACAIDPQGWMLQELTYVGKEHTGLPILQPIEYFAADLGLDIASFLKHCQSGIFTHYRFGSYYRISKEDYAKDLERIGLKGIISTKDTNKNNRI